MYLLIISVMIQIEILLHTSDGFSSCSKWHISNKCFWKKERISFNICLQWLDMIRLKICLRDIIERIEFPEDNISREIQDWHLYVWCNDRHYQYRLNSICFTHVMIDTLNSLFCKFLGIILEIRLYIIKFHTKFNVIDINV